MLSVFFSVLSTKYESFSVGPEHPDTIGLIDIGVLCIFLRKYMHCVLTFCGSSVRNLFVILSKW